MIEEEKVYMNDVWRGTYEIWQNPDFGKIYSQVTGKSMFSIENTQIFVSHKILIGNTTLYVYCPTNVTGIKDILYLAQKLKVGHIWIYTVHKIDQLSTFFLKKDFTFIIDLAPRENDLLMKMTSNRRNEIRRAQREELIINLAETEEEFNNWWKIYTNVASTKRFEIQSYNLVMRLFKNHSLSKLFVSIFNDKIVGGAFFLTGKYPVYWLGAIDRDYKNLNIGALNIYTAIQHFKNAGYTLLDLGGAVIDDNHGPTLFKKNFGGDIAEANIYDVPVCQAKTKLIENLQKLRCFMYYFVNGKMPRGLP